MDRLVGRVALVTGASSGIGAGITSLLVQSGLKVVGAARRVEEIQKHASQLEGSKGSLVGIKCDLTKDEQVHSMFDEIKKIHGGVDICINNAGLNIPSTLLDGNTKDWRHILDVNIVAMCLCTKLAVESMKQRGVDDGHILNLSSMAGHKVATLPPINFYTSSKYFVRAMTEALRQEMRLNGSKIRVSAISPGIVATELQIISDPASVPGVEELFQLKPLSPQDIAASVLHILSSPPHVEINDLLVRPTDMKL